MCTHHYGISWIIDDEPINTKVWYMALLPAGGDRRWYIYNSYEEAGGSDEVVGSCESLHLCDLLGHCLHHITSAGIKAGECVPVLDD
mmetsp:Transcript_28678/g.48828  ORF Transcript_28678/g.48828 Transcript_28678/m.48828 type:complete len:87 (+) Transcript_28678:915-1175(+)